MTLASMVHQYHATFTTHYAARLLPRQHRALAAVQRCRTPEAGELQLRCTGCEQHRQQPLSCGHRSCPACQNHEATQWLDRQQAKLLPVEYFMATFTLPYELRAAASTRANGSGKRQRANTSLMNSPWPRCFGHVFWPP